MSPSPTRLNRRNADDDAGDVGGGGSIRDREGRGAAGRSGRNFEVDLTWRDI